VDDQDNEHPYTVRITESPATFTRQLGAFRQTMISWFAFVALMLLVVQAAILRWGLSPLRRIEHELKDVENGHAERLGEDFPRELKGLARNLNLLISNERRHLERYRHTLADLAHSLKTPLAVLRSSASNHREDEQLATLVDEQVSSMTELVEYQLQKATMVGTASVVRGVAVGEIVPRIIRSLRKVYQRKEIDFETGIDTGAEFFGESGDLMELLGNLLDNACKWCTRRVGISVHAVANGEWRNGLRIDVYDDGKGIDAQRVDEVLQRGVRGDSRVPGHGIGLAVVSEIVSAYGGDIQVAQSDWGGARITLRIDYGR
jgi:two-component system sensor histidine kinase PhoQ